MQDRNYRCSLTPGRAAFHTQITFTFGGRRRVVVETDRVVPYVRATADRAKPEFAPVVSSLSHRRPALTPFGGRIQTTEHTSQADEQQPVVPGEGEVAQHDDDDAEDQQHQHQHRHPLWAHLCGLGYRWRVARGGVRPTRSGRGRICRRGHPAARLSLGRSHGETS